MQKNHLKAIKDGLRVLQSMMSSAFYDESESSRIFGWEVKPVDDRIGIGFWVNLDQPEFENLMQELQTVDSFLLSPIDQSVDFSLSLKNGVQELTRNEKSAFYMPLFEGMRANLVCKHWMKMLDIIGQNSFKTSWMFPFEMLPMMTILNSS